MSNSTELDFTSNNWSNKIMLNLFGPTSEYLGKELASLTKAGVENIKTVIECLYRMRNNNEGCVNPRIAKLILKAAEDTPDYASLLYFASILATSATTSSGTDDSALPVAMRVCAMSSFEISTHYLIYKALHKIWRNHSVLSFDKDRDNCEIIFAQDDIKQIMGVDNYSNSDVILERTIRALSASKLISKFQMCGSDALREKMSIEYPKYAVLCSLSVEGMSLFMWVNGLSDFKTQDFLMIPEEKFILRSYLQGHKLFDTGLTAEKPNYIKI